MEVIIMAAKKGVLEAIVGLGGVLVLFAAMWLFSARPGDGKSACIESNGGGAKPVAAFGEKSAKGESPSAVVLRSYEALKAGDMAAYRACFTSEAFRRVSAVVGASGLDGKGIPDMGSVKIESVRESGDTAQVKVSIRLPDGDETDTHSVRRTAIGWLMD
jgi:hypothetical protein